MKIILRMLPVLLLLLLPGLLHAEEGEENQAGLVIRHGDGRVTTACVGFSEPSISGLELLRRSGVPMVAQGSGIGAAVCKIDGEGCEYPTEDCFCRRDGAQSIYWAYSKLKNGEWMYSPLGASNTTVLPGDVEGWAWGSGNSGTGAQPPVQTFDQVCAVPGQHPGVSTQPSAVSRQPEASIQPSANSQQPTTTDNEQLTTNNNQALNYLAFGAIALALLASIVIAARHH